MSQQHKKRDFYEVLGVTSTATSDEIRIAYKKLALKWHPDKNQDRLAEAEAAFKETVHAYGVLSNEAERKWYDSHKDSVLSGRTHADDDGDQGPQEEAKFYPYFQDDCFDGSFTTKPKGFFTVYGAVFQDILQEESRNDLPLFGDMGTSADDVLDFYESWCGYYTKKDFARCDKYREQDAQSRLERRAMQRENQKLRNAAQVAYVTTVRMVVKHAMEKDPRVGMAHLEKRQRREEQLQAAEEKRKEQLRKAAEELERMRLDRTPEEIAEEERRAREHEKLYSMLMGENSGSDEEDEEEEEEEEEEEDSLTCKPCKKTFKSQKQLDEHFKSAKHKATLKSLGLEVPSAPPPSTSNDASNEGGGKKTAKQRQVARRAMKEQLEKEREEAEAAAEQERLSRGPEHLPPPSTSDVSGGDAPSPPAPEKDNNNDDEDDDKGVVHQCVKCRAIYPSRNALMTHVKDTGHAVPPARLGKKAKKGGK
eukprot:PhF_6_TR8458/c0_g1_i1/m.13208/K09506/DNAJA5; DnaJ homolog subfamily A member 5